MILRNMNLFETQAEGKRFKNRGAYIILQSPDYSSPNFYSFEADLPRPRVCLKLVEYFTSFNEHFETIPMFLQVQAYYKYEEVLDSDEELDFELINDNFASDTN